MSGVSLERGANFLDLAFDWFILVRCADSSGDTDLEQWNPTSGESKADQHARLGQKYASLGHRGRRPYAQRADNYQSGDQLPRPIDQVPHDLLTAHERKLNSTYAPVWLRTAYGRGTDARHQELLAAVENDLSDVLDGEDRLLDESTRYAFEDAPATAEGSNDVDASWRRVLAFAPVLIERIAGGLYADLNVPWTDPSLSPPSPSSPSPPSPSTLALGQKHFFVADAQAMLTGYLLWVHVDEFGGAVQRNRIQPAHLLTIAGRRATGMSLEEIIGWREVGRDGILEDFGVVEGYTNAGSWTPPE
ncbi:hypothetical protein MMC07_006783 [Pseudocyphellaria aurata]|nr:hypothetical protein [Pseudocyphellaria aurata]